MTNALSYSRRSGRVARLTGRSSELSVLDRLIGAVRAGQSRVLVVSGEPGVGKTALLEYLAGRAGGCRVERAAGVQSEMELAFAALAAVPGPHPPRPVDVLLDAFALWFTGQRDDGSGPHLTQALELLLALDVSNNEADRWAWLTAGTAIDLIGLELWDAESWYALTTAQVRFAREMGALVHLQFALNYLASAQTITWPPLRRPWASWPRRRS